MLIVSCSEEVSPVDHAAADTWQIFNTATSPLPDNQVQALLVQNDVTWIGTANGLGRDARRQMGHLRYHQCRPSLAVHHRPCRGCLGNDLGRNSSFPDALAVDANNVLWLGVKGTMGGMLVRVEDDTWEILNRSNAGCFTGGGINSIVLSGHVRLIGAGDGLVIFDGQEWSCYNTNISAMPDNFIYTFAVDDRGNTWIGTVGSGLVLIKGGNLRMSRT